MKRIVLSLLLLSALSSVGTLFHSQQALAVSAADWKPGRIIDDVVFQNKNAMTVAQIQQFIESKVPACDTWGTLPMWSGGPTRAQWSADNGKDLAPYTCLRDYLENPTTKANNASDPRISVPGGLSAAQLIYNASQAQNVNPQVFLTLLQKEQSLVTDDWPYARQFEKATGNNCPDTAPCNPTYAWLWTQVNNAGAQFNNYVANFDNYNYAPGWNNILYHPNGACGTRSIFIENAYTAALYIYTPYTPNQAALDNMYGTGDGCSAYGNRNFWRLFNDWFGSSIGAPYDSQYFSSTPFGQKLEYGQTSTMTITLTNVGTNTWYSDGNTPPGVAPVRLATRDYSTIESADLTDTNWLSPAQIRMTQASVTPGQNATFTFRLKAPNRTATMKNYIAPILDGVGVIKDTGMLLTVQSVAPSYEMVGAANVSQSITPNGTSNVTYTIKNTGTRTWYSDGNTPPQQRPMRLISNNYKLIEFADLTDTNWLSPAQIRMTQASVAPGQNATFTFRLKAPAAKKMGHSYAFTPIIDGSHALDYKGMSLAVDVPEPVITYTIEDVDIRGSMAASTTRASSIVLKNTGNTVWRDETTKSQYSPLRLVRVTPSYTSSKLYDPLTWLSPAQIRLKEAVVNPGELGTFEFNLVAPATAGSYYEPFGLALDGRWGPGPIVVAPLFTVY